MYAASLKLFLLRQDNETGVKGKQALFSFIVIWGFGCCPRRWYSSVQAAVCAMLQQHMHAHDLLQGIHLHLVLGTGSSV
jgi:hypothetical protein